MVGQSAGHVFEAMVLHQGFVSRPSGLALGGAEMAEEVLVVGVGQRQGAALARPARERGPDLCIALLNWRCQPFPSSR